MDKKGKSILFLIDIIIKNMIKFDDVSLNQIKAFQPHKKVLIAYWLTVIGEY